MNKYKFKDNLTEGIITSRPNRFIMLVNFNGKIEEAHCPSTGKIGNIEFNNIPCLVSKSNNKNRRTKYTVEAISLDNPNKKEKSWIGINQNRINEYVKFFLRQGRFNKIVGNFNQLKREVKLANSRIDFLLDDTFLEVKMPLITLAGQNPQKNKSKFNSFDRLIKHFEDLSKNTRAIVLLCYLYNAKPFEPPKTDKTNKKVKSAASKAIKQGVEMWQANYSINKNSVSLAKYFKLDII